METKPPPRVDVAIVNWNTAAQAISAAGGYDSSAGVDARVTVIDNASDQPDRELLRDAQGETFTLIQGEENLGFGHAANRALADGDGDFVLVSNADVMPDPGAVAALVEAFESRPDTGLVGPVFRGTDNYHDQLPGPFTLLVRIVVGGYNRKPIGVPPPGRALVVEQPSGACFLMSRELWERTGGFDEQFFLWYEDVDLAKRLNDLGKTGLVAGSAQVDHLGGESFSRLDKGDQQALRLASLGRYLDLHHRWSAILAKPLLWISRRARARTSSAPES